MTNWFQYVERRSEPFSENGRFVRVVEDVIVEIRGPDADKLMQGQVTADIDELGSEDSAYSALCTNKGRVISTFLIYHSDDAFYCRLPRDNANLFAETFKKYAVFYKVEILLREDLGILVLFDDSLLENLPQIHFSLHHANGVNEIWIEQPAWESTLDTLAELSPAPERKWQLAKIQMGRPDIHSSTAETFLPHALSLDLAEAISFTKGCYTGQEIVARTHYRGKSKKRLFRLELDLAPPSAGSELRDLQGKNLGTVVNAVAVSANRSELLASANIDLVEQGELLIQESKSTYHVQPLPWQIE